MLNWNSMKILTLSVKNISNLTTFEQMDVIHLLKFNKFTVSELL